MLDNSIECLVVGEEAVTNFSRNHAHWAGICERSWKCEHHEEFVFLKKVNIPSGALVMGSLIFLRHREIFIYVILARHETKKRKCNEKGKIVFASKILCKSVVVFVVDRKYLLYSVSWQTKCFWIVELQLCIYIQFRLFIFPRTVNIYYCGRRQIFSERAISPLGSGIPLGIKAFNKNKKYAQYDDKT